MTEVLQKEAALETELVQKAKQAKAAAGELAKADTTLKNKALELISQQLMAEKAFILNSGLILDMLIKEYGIIKSLNHSNLKDFQIHII